MRGLKSYTSFIMKKEKEKENGGEKQNSSTPERNLVSLPCLIRVANSTNLYSLRLHHKFPIKDRKWSTIANRRKRVVEKLEDTATPWSFKLYFSDRVALNR